MKKFLNIIIVAMLGMVAFSVSAQDRATAVLQHGSTTKVYYDGNAFVSAYEEAQPGDVISLSIGTFQAPQKVEKSVRIQGSGHNTVIKGDINFNGATAIDGLWIDGVRFLSKVTFSGILNNTTVKRVRFDGRCDISTTGQNLLMLQNRFGDVCDNSKMSGGLVYNNCIINNLEMTQCKDTNSKCKMVANNCYIGRWYWTTGNGGWPCAAGGVIRNSFLKTLGVNSYINVEALYPQITLEDVVGIFVASSESDVHNYTMLTETEFNALFVNGGFYQLTEAATAQYLGTDGTQIGIYGGETPYTAVPAIPQIVETNIGSATNSQGKLPVKIKVQVNK